MLQWCCNAPATTDPGRVGEAGGGGGSEALEMQVRGGTKGGYRQRMQSKPKTVVVKKNKSCKKKVFKATEWKNKIKHKVYILIWDHLYVFLEWSWLNDGILWTYMNFVNP